MTIQNYPVLSADTGLSAYMAKIKQFPVLTADEEYSLATKVAHEKDIDSAHQLVTSHLRLVAKIANGYKGYGLPLVDIISEGNIGLMQAVKRFIPEKGVRLATYATWWIKAAIQEYILRSWSLVKIGTTAAQKKLFFNLRQIKNKIVNFANRSLTHQEIKDIADELSVPEHEVSSMEQRMYHTDASLNEQVNNHSYQGDSSTTEKIDMLESTDSDHELIIGDVQEAAHRKQLLLNALDQLNERERDIIIKRRLTSPTVTLDELSKIYKVSCERIRQIEYRAFEKMKECIAGH